MSNVPPQMPPQPGYPPVMPQQMQPPPGPPQAPPPGYPAPVPQPTPGAYPQMPPQPGPPMSAGPFPTPVTEENTVNWADLLNEAAQAPGFEPLPVGEYDVTIEDADAGKSSTGKTMFKVRFKVTVGPYAGKIIMNNFTISPENANALSFFFKHMAILGLDAGYFAQQPPPALVASHLVGRSCRVQIKHRVYQGATQMDVANLMPAGGAGMPQAVAQPVPMQQPGVPQGLPVPQQAPMQAPMQAPPQYAPPAAPAAAPGYPPQAPPAAPPMQQAPVQPGQVAPPPW